MNKLALSVVAIALTAGCSPFGSSYSGPPACQILTAPLARSVIGAKARQVRSESVGPYTSVCGYKNGYSAIEVTAGTWGWLGKTVQGPPVSGIGDEAYMSPFGLLARKGGNAVQVSVSLDQPLGAPVKQGQAKEEQSEKQLASQLIAKL